MIGYDELSMTCSFISNKGGIYRSYTDSMAGYDELSMTSSSIANIGGI